MKLIAALAVLTVSLTGCTFALGAKAPCDWEPSLRQGYPPAAVVLEGPRGLGLRLWIAHGVIVHSSQEHGTFVLTNEHVAATLVSLREASSEEATVGIMDPASGTERVFHVEPFFPDAPTLEKENAITEGDDRLAKFEQQFRRLFRRDLALLRVTDATGPIPCASLGALSALDAREPFVAMPIYPARSPRRIELPGPPATSITRIDPPGEEGMSGSGIFDADGRLYGLISTKIDESRLSQFRRAFDWDLDANLGLTPLSSIVSWLREHDLAWISATTKIDLDLVTRAAARGDGEALRGLLRDPLAHHDLRPAALHALARLDSLSSSELASFVETDRDHVVREEAFEAGLRRSPVEFDELGAALVATDRDRDGTTAVIATIESRCAIPAATERSLRALLDDSRLPSERRARAALALCRCGVASIASLAPDLRDSVLESRLKDSLSSPREEGTVTTLCARAGDRLGARLEIDPRLSEVASHSIVLGAEETSTTNRVKAAFGKNVLGPRVRLRVSDGVVHVEPTRRE